MPNFTIDIFELMFLAEACIPPRPIARMSFWYDMIGRHYDQMSKSERKRAFEWMKDKLDLNEPDHQVFYARYNPDNQYLVHTEYEGQKGTVQCFRFNDKYHTTKSTHVCEEYIVKVEKGGG